LTPKNEAFAFESSKCLTHRLAADTNKFCNSAFRGELAAAGKLLRAKLGPQVFIELVIDGNGAVGVNLDFAKGV
jgi:hypothetical protein